MPHGISFTPRRGDGRAGARLSHTADGGTTSGNRGGKGAAKGLLLQCVSAPFAVRFGSFCSAFRLLLQRRSGSFAAGEANLFATCFRFFALRLSKKRFAERIFSFRNGSSARTLFFALSNWNSAIYKKYSSLWLKFAGASREIVRNSRKKRHFCLEKVEKYTFQKL